MINVFMYLNNAEKLDTLRNSFISYFRSVKCAYKITSCIKHSDAAAYIEKNSSDDIYVFDFSDFDKAAVLAARFNTKNPLGIWIFVGENINSLLRILPLRPSAYIGSINSAGQVNGVLKALHRRCENVRKENYFTFKKDGKYIKVPYNEINYFESNAKKVVLHLTKSTDTYFFNEKLDNISAHLPDFFVRCHQSYLVNINMVKRFDAKNHIFTMIDNDEVWISRRLYTETKNKYEAFTGKGNV